MIRKRVKDHTAIDQAMKWFDGIATKMLNAGKIPYIEIGEWEEERTLPQNSKIWAIFTDMEKQLVWHGQKMSREDWKDLICHEWKSQKLIPSISGGFCVLNARTSKASKREISDLIEIAMAFGSSMNILWSEPALKIYSEYREAKNDSVRTSS